MQGSTTSGPTPNGGTGAGSNGGTGSAVGTTPAATVAKGSSGARAGAAVDGASTGRSGVVVAASRTAGGGGASADGASGGSAGSAVSPANAKTPEERRATLDKQLNDSLGSFDARLRREQQKIAQERDARQATVAASTTTDGAAKTGTDQTADAAGSTATEVPAKPSESHGGRVSKRGDTRSPHAGDLKSDKTGGANGSTNGNGALGNVIPDGNDDDIVARRLRRAAEQETDPELKDKLWKEYVEYKKNAQVQ
ncbi:MAG TPA: hypothetical protein VNO35_17855 [Steroidobacteraceae bacterium]|nr:hypothetical protein [Steroidobacteraceae bacterium]